MNSIKDYYINYLKIFNENNFINYFKNLELLDTPIKKNYSDYGKFLKF